MKKYKVSYEGKNGVETHTFYEADEALIKKTQILDAADIICVNCIEDTLNNEGICEKCPVRKLCNSLEEKS